MGPSNPRPSSLHKREALLDAACELFLARGYAEVSIDEVVACVSQSKTNVYRWFGGKRELFVACVKRMLQLWVEHLPLDYLDMPPRDALYALGKQILHLVLSERAVTLHRLVIAESMDFPEVAQAWVEAGPAQSYQRIAELLERYQHDDSFRPLDGLSTARFFHHVLTGDLQLQVLLGTGTRPNEAQLEEHLDQVLDLFMPACQAPSRH